jgi:hypothetical protein
MPNTGTLVPAMLLLWMILRGVCEGMIMTRYTDRMADPEARDDMDGVRVHRWFGLYHGLCLLRDAALVELVWVATISGGLYHLTVAGTLFVGWELFELTYAGTRYGFGSLVTDHENVLGLVQVKGIWTGAIHAGRILIGASLIVGGLV